MVRLLASRYDMPQADIKNIVQGTFDAIIETLAKDGRLELRNFGVFEVKRRGARKARNPKTGVVVDVPPRKVVTFKPGRLMEMSVREQHPVSSGLDSSPLGDPR